MTITAKVIADSISEEGKRITTLQLKYPRFIHAEFMTHRVFSRNASSSRAIPVKRMIEDVMSDPAMPIHWGKNQPGMQAREEHFDPVLLFCEDLNFGGGSYEKRSSADAWLEARSRAAEVAMAFADAGYHKQIVNRLLEPFQHIHVVVTATEWANFFALRRHEDAQPEIKALADAIYESMEASTPRLLKVGEWHLPYVTDDDRKNFTNFGAGAEVQHLCRISAARCARVSYLKHDGTSPSIEDDLKLYERLIEHTPMHASPAEHQATPDTTHCVITYDESGDADKDLVWKNPYLQGNLTGWIQFRKTLANECVHG